jgi:hypothetical protein
MKVVDFFKLYNIVLRLGFEILKGTVLFLVFEHNSNFNLYVLIKTKCPNVWGPFCNSFCSNHD